MKPNLVLLGSLLLFCGFAKNPDEADTQLAELQKRVNDRKVQAEFVDANSAFALDLYQQLRTTPGNLFFSPHSISTALAMTYAGARGRTEEQMAGALHFDLPQDQLHPAFGQLLTDLNAAQRSVQLFVANSLWPARGLPLRQDFSRQVQEHYAARITPLDYAQTEAARRTINDWVEEQTRDKIKNIIQPGLLAPNTALVLANAIYFKGVWRTPFRPEQTRALPFHLSPTARTETPMMHQRRLECRFNEDPEVQLLEMAYRGDSVSMVAILPRSVDGLAALEQGLRLPRLKAWLDGLREAKVDVWFPRFKATSQFRLDPPLKALGMVDAFGAADFSGMFERGGANISAVVHKAFVAVDEEGTEAAAATAVVMKRSAAPNPPSFRADHPFLFLIRHRGTGCILFLGRIANPEQPSQG